MKALRKFLDSQHHHFAPGGKLEKLYPLYEATDTFLYTPGEVTKGASHVRDASDLKRIMSIVVVSLIPCILMALYNTGLQAHRAIAAGSLPLDTWQTKAMQAMGLAFDPSSLLACVVHGALYFVPVMLVTYIVGGNVEVVFAAIRKHEVNEGFLVTGMLIPLTLPATIPLWQVALGTVFGVIFGKEIFGGTGMNILNPALVTRAFLFFAYPAQISGDKVWVAAQTKADGYSGATWLAEAATGGIHRLQEGVSWTHAFLGTIPGSMGETSTLACLIGALILIVTGVGSWRIMAGVVAGSFLMATALNAFAGPTSGPLFSIPFHWHIVLGGWAFGMAFMATDPVSAAHTEKGKWVYGLLIGLVVVLIRTVNPAYPESMMLTILLLNVFAPTIDHFVMAANIKRRKARHAIV